VDITVTPGSATLAGVDVFVDYDATVLTATAVAAADGFGTCYVNPSPDTDTITCSLSSTNPGLSGTVAALSFAVVGTAGSTSPLNVSAFSCVDENGALTACDTADGLVTVGQTPTPGPTPPPPSTGSTGVAECPLGGCITPAAFPDTGGGSPGTALPLLGALTLLAVGTALATTTYLPAQRRRFQK
jgi:hypothetical protein